MRTGGDKSQAEACRDKKEPRHPGVVLAGVHILCTLNKWLDPGLIRAGSLAFHYLSNM